MNTLHVIDREKWRAWLQANGEKEKEIWLVFYRKHTGKKILAYDEAVEEALCFGWIDSIIKRLDEMTYARKFTPRKKGSRWSELNIRRAKKMIAAGLMTPIGLTKFEPGIFKRKSSTARPGESAASAIPAFILEAMAADKSAWVYFQALAPSYRRLYCRWVSSAKKEETRQKRLTELVATMRAGRKLGLK